jgi:serine/threonine protein phosphatase PrpC
MTKKGFWQPGIEKPNQDNYFIFKNFNNNSNNYYIGICDGHGKLGKEISSYISLNLPQNLNKNILQSNLNINNDSISTISQIIIKTFFEINKSLKNNSNINTSLSGSTCSSIILTKNRLISINLGDSRCVLGKYNKNNNLWLYKELTKDHKVSEEKERERVIKKGGKIYKEKDEFGNSKGIMRIWEKEEGYIGLALTRSFGDEILSKKGVICEPEIKEFLLEKDDKFIVIGSDGLWDYISNQECINIVKDFFLKNDIKGAGNYLYKEASKRWILEQDIVDDISIILIFFDN